MFPVIEAGALHLAFVEREAEWLDQVQRGAGGEAGATGVARVAGDLGRHQHDLQRGTCGPEDMSTHDQGRKRWGQQKLGSVRAKPQLNAEEKTHILGRLTAAEGLERFLHTKYVGQKRFSLEGGESFIASMDELVQRSGAKGVQEIVIGMAHRGRLNVLVNTLGKMPKYLIAEFEHTAHAAQPSGDWKYHKGFSHDANTRGVTVH